MGTNRALWFLILGLVVLPACTQTYEPGKAQASKTLYHCAMHPQIVSDKPGECPICHMHLVPFTPNGEVRGAGTSSQVAIRMTPGIEQQIGVQVSEVQVRDLVLLIRAAARVAYDPQLYSAALEHREARKFLAQARKNKNEESLEQAQATVRASELRLRQMGLAEEQMEEISRPGYDLSGLLVGSLGGAVWIYAEIPDTQMNAIRTGQPVELTSPAMPGKTFKGTVKGIDPIVSSETRTVRARIRVADPAGELKPGVYLSAVIQTSLGKVLSLPESAVMDTGTRQLVYVQTAPGSYEPRPVRLGRQAEGYYEVLGGLNPGDKVASSANFLIDSESRIQAVTREAIK
jgi:Cu(I)/Ag(I) efflux system membrane fusion protein